MKQIKLPRLMWKRNPATKIVENKKAKMNKEACKKQNYTKYQEW